MQEATDWNLQQPPIDDVESSILAECLPYSACRFFTLLYKLHLDLVSFKELV